MRSVIDVRFNYQHPTYLHAREEAFLRSGGWCQFCGLFPAEHSHHWRHPKGSGPYLPEAQTTADELTALWERCHEHATTLRRFEGENWQLEHAFGQAVSQCYTGSASKASVPSSSEAELVSIPPPQRIGRRQRLHGSEEATAPSPTTHDCENSNAKSASGSTLMAARPSRRQRYEQTSKEQQDS